MFLRRVLITNADHMTPERHNSLWWCKQTKCFNWSDEIKTVHSN